MPRKLKNLRITRVDLVDKGANYDPKTGAGAFILLVKRAVDSLGPATFAETLRRVRAARLAYPAMTEEEPPMPSRADAAVEALIQKVADQERRRSRGETIDNSAAQDLNDLVVTGAEAMVTDADVAERASALMKADPFLDETDAREVARARVTADAMSAVMRDERLVKLSRKIARHRDMSAVPMKSASAAVKAEPNEVEAEGLRRAHVLHEKPGCPNQR